MLVHSQRRIFLHPLRIVSTGIAALKVSWEEIVPDGHVGAGDLGELDGARETLVTLGVICGELAGVFSAKGRIETYSS